MSIKITINHALKKYGDFVAIPDLSLEIKPGEFFTLLGPSGCGKTTLLRMIAGFNSIEGGEFYFGDRLINDLDPSKRNIGMVFQNYAIFPHLTVRKNVAFGLQNRKLPKEEIKEKTDKFMELMKIKEYADRLPEKLSGGQQQRVALARALAIEPKLIICDEATSALDVTVQAQIVELLRKLQREMGLSLLLICHDLALVQEMCDRVLVMYQGRIVEEGTPDEVIQNPQQEYTKILIDSVF